MKPQHRTIRRVDTLTWLKAYHDAPRDADLALLAGHPANEPEQVMILLTLTHPTIDEATVVLSAEQARVMADIFDAAMRKFPEDSFAQALPNLILALRAAADKLEAGIG